MDTLSKYLIRSMLTTIVLVLLILLSLSMLFEFITQLGDLEGQYGIKEALLFSFLRLPQLSFDMMPIATLIGSLLSLGSLSTNSELIVIRTAGVSIGRLASMVAMSGAILLSITVLIGEFIAPPMDYFARTMRDEARYNQQGSAFGSEAWFKDGPIILHLERVNTEFDFGSIYLFKLNEDNSLNSIALADNSAIGPDEKWVLENYRETRFQDEDVQVSSSSTTIESFDIDSDLLGTTLVKPASLSARGLINYINYLNKNELSAIRYEMEFWSRIATTLTVVVMPILALTFVFGSLRYVGSGSRLMMGILIGLGYFLLSEMLSNSGQVFHINPALISWIPTVILIIITAVTLKRVS